MGEPSEIQVCIIHKSSIAWSKTKIEITISCGPSGQRAQFFTPAQKNKKKA
jgi:hypothetical protein